MAIKETHQPLEVAEQQSAVPLRFTHLPIEVAEQQATVPLRFTQVFIEVAEMPFVGRFSKKIFWRRFFSGRRRDLRAGLMSRIH